MTKVTQQEQVLFHLKNIGSITPIEALDAYGCFRLAPIIQRLRRQGLRIKTEKVPTPSGRATYAKYILEGQAILPGDKVRVVRKVLEEDGWCNGWVDIMDLAIGQVFTVDYVNKYGVYLNAARPLDLGFPPSSLEIVE